jgi:hypothetical protein
MEEIGKGVLYILLGLAMIALVLTHFKYLPDKRQESASRHLTLMITGLGLIVVGVTWIL